MNRIISCKCCKSVILIRINDSQQLILIPVSVGQRLQNLHFLNRHPEPTMIFILHSEALESVMCDVIEIRLKRRDATRSKIE